MRSKTLPALLAVLAMVSIGFFDTTPVSASKVPPGSTRVTTTQLQKVGKVQCAFISGSWTAGTLYSSKYFVSHVRQYQLTVTASQKSTGSKKRALQRDAARWKTKALDQKSACTNIQINPNETPPVRATGNESIEFCKLEDSVVNRQPISMRIGFPLLTTNLPLNGNITIGVIPIDFSDVPGTYQPLTKAQSQLDQFAQWISQVSNNKVTISYRTLPTWVRIPHSSDSYSLEKSGFGMQLAQDAVTAADSQFDFTSISTVFFYLPDAVVNVVDGFQTNDGSNGIRLTTNEGLIRFWFGAGSYFYKNNRTLWSFYAHELLHAFGLTDLYVRNWTSNTPEPFNGYDVMANQDSSQNLASWSRFLLGWLFDNQIYCIRSSQLTTSDISLIPINRTTDGFKSVMIPLSATRILVVESRRDDYMSEKLPTGSNGAIAYVVDTSIGNGIGSTAVLTPKGHSLITVPGAPPMFNAFIKKGESVSTDGIIVSVTYSGSYDTIRITK